MPSAGLGMEEGSDTLQTGQTDYLGQHLEAFSMRPGLGAPPLTWLITVYCPIPLCPEPANPGCDGHRCGPQ